ncbi:lipopolysaccharide biosynthesis protein [Microbacterium aurantiacum]|uniref:O-antigen/teichoic acid export membrane protein n=1 Tax=Microbacterium aurantiacum TaxID=162393 RepID=A0A0M8MGP4_9MICO|nr:hypothetical protein [Microbacterium chocolatum]ANG85236.1 hypothetical protein A8L33_07430 [Microbacterium chocolatum]KOS11138.1 hypothetical protein XI38_07730 [Microbacterium chocolatum]
MSERLSPARRLSAFTVTTGLGAAVTVLAAPVIIGGAGEYDWGVLSSIQSAAGLFGVLVAFGWGTTGAGEVSAMEPARRPQWYADSLVSRMYLFVLAYPAMVAVMWVLNPGYFALVAVGCAAYLAAYVGASWYFIGEARPGRLFGIDMLPQTLGVLVSLVVMLLTQSLVATVATQLVFNVSATVISAAVILRNQGKPVRFNWSLPDVVRRLGRQRHAVITAATQAAYVSAPLLILNALSPTTMALYAMGDKLFRFGLTAFAPILQFIQGWMSEKGQDALPSRVKKALTIVPFVSAFAGACVFALGPWAAALLSQGQIDLGYDLSFVFGLVLFAVSIGQVLGLAALVQLGRTRDLAVSTVIGAVAGIPLMIAGAVLFSVNGVAWALAISEILVGAYQASAVVREIRRRRGAVA